MSLSLSGHRVKVKVVVEKGLERLCHGSSLPGPKGLSAPLAACQAMGFATALCGAPTAPPAPSLLLPVAPPSQGAYLCSPAAPGVASPWG